MDGWMLVGKILTTLERKTFDLCVYGGLMELTMMGRHVISLFSLLSVFLLLIFCSLFRFASVLSRALLPISLSHVFRCLGFGPGTSATMNHPDKRLGET